MSGIVRKGIASVPRRYSLVMFLLFSIFTGILAQSEGDYRSAGSGDFDQAGTWQIYSLGSWIAASTAPDDTNGTVTIQSGHTVNIDADHTINDLAIYGTLHVEIDIVLTVLGDIHVYPSGTMNVDDRPLITFDDPAVIAVYGNFINEGTVVFEDALVVVAGNFESTGSTSMNNPFILDAGNIVVGGDVTGNFDFGGDAEGQLSAVNPGATVNINPTDTYGTVIPFWVGFFFPDILDILNTVIYGGPDPCPYTIIGPLSTISCSGATVYYEITSTSATSPTYQWEVNDGMGWINVTDGGVYSGANTALLTISSAGASMDGYIFRCELEDASSCVKKSYAATLTISNDAAPSAPTTTGASGCINTSVTLTASGAGIGEDYFWYDASAGGTRLQFSGGIYTTPVLTATTTYYASVYNTTSGCESERTSATATIGATNTAGAPSSTETLCINTPLTAITHATTLATSIANDGVDGANGLPAGVSATWAANVITISGTPSAAGVYPYSIALIGGCGTVNATGTITVTPDMTVGAASSTETLCINTPLTAITHATTLATSIANDGVDGANGLPAGVSASWAANVITISGTPSAAGVYPYSIALIGGCGTVNATGTITVTPDMTVGAASSTQTLCINTPLTAITHATTLATSIANDGVDGANGLPAGVSASWAANVITISGTPSAAGVYPYSIALIGGCGTVNATGTITVTPDMTVGAASSTETLCINTPLTAITHATTLATSIANDGVDGANGLPAGVSASWAANVITISGTPSAAGVYPYSIALIGGCGTVNATGTITVTPDMTVGAPSSTETLCINTPLTAITHATTLATSIANDGVDGANGLPAGVSASWAANVITISGTPSAAGVYPYSIALIGGCGTVNATGTITVTPDMTVGAASSTETLCINTPLTAITHATTLATSIANDGVDGANGLPAGVSASWAANVITISGTPSAAGVYPYSIALIGGCGTVNATGTITVTPDMTVGAASSTETLCINTPLTAITHATTLATSIANDGVDGANGLPAGVSASWAANVITISGTPSAAGVYPYSIALIGGCGTVNATGTITVTPDMTVGAASSTETLCINTPLTAITHATTLATSIANDGVDGANGLPAGVSASWAANVITISGTPSAAGVYPYSIALIGGCGTVNATGTITVTPDMTVGAASSTETLCINTPLTAITHATTLATSIANDGVDGANGLPAGVSATWAANVITISGTPSAAGVYPYSIALIGGCGTVNATGTITVTPDMTVGAASSTETLCINTPLTAITHATTLATSIANDGVDGANGLPAGVSASWAANVITISGTPSAAGVYPYSIALIGGCGTVNATGTITVTPDMTVGAASSTETLCINTPLTAITHATTLATSIANDGVDGANGLPAGVSATWAANVITISGTPSAAGVYPYSIALIGGCGTVNATGTITVTPDMTVGAASSTETLCINTPLTAITHATTLATSIANDGVDGANGLPAGVSASWAANVITISGTPSAAGVYPYSIALIGGCGTVNATGTITVTPDMTVGAASSTETLCINTPLTAITHATTLATSIANDGVDGANGLPAGVSATWAANVITISGTPSAAGVYPYSIALIGGCGTVNATGTITVTPDMTVGAASSTETLCINTPLTAITHATTLATSIANDGVDGANGLPAGVSATWAANVITISGTPSAAGVYPYSIALIGGCGTVNATGTITVTPDMTVGAASSTETLCINTPLTAITHATTLATSIANDGVDGANGLPAGVSASWAANVITISGTPSAAGVYPYSIALIGGCGTVNATGTITVTPDMTVGAASSTETLCINTPLTAITHATTLATSIANDGVDGANGLPAGVSASWAANVITISGTPSAAGVYPYSIALIGGCGTVNATGTITVTPDMTVGAASSTETLCINTPLTAITHATTLATSIANDGVDGANGLPAGVSASWAANVITISGTPSAAGVYPYSIALIGGCGTVNATGTITVTPDMTVGAPSSTETLCINTPLTAITHATTLATSIANDGVDGANGLPAGVSASWAANVITISGTPSAAGVYPYSIALIGGCGTVNATGTITVTPDMTVGAASSTETLCINTPLTAITHATTLATSIANDGVDGANGLPAGVSATWAANVITISGTPSAAGVYPYSIALIGGCGTVNATGTITVTPDMTVGAASSTETLCINTPLTAITHATTLATSIANDGVDGANGLPAGVSASWAANVITISGTPSAAGVYPYSIALIGGCGTVNATGTITVTPDMTVGAASSTETLCINTPLTAITHATTLATSIANDGVDGANGLPAGVSASWAANVITISGTPSAAGVYPYSIALIGGCGTVNATGTITVTVGNTTIPPDNAISDPAEVCSGDGSIVLSYSGGDLGTNGVAVWYDDAALTSQVGTGNGLSLAGTNSNNYLLCKV